MIEFKKITIKDLIYIKESLFNVLSNSCDYSLGVLYMRKDYFDTKIAYFPSRKEKKYFVICYTYDNFKRSYFYPILNIKYKKKIKYTIIDVFNELFLNSNDSPTIFCCLNKEQIRVLNNIFPINESYFNRNWSDYIYLTNDLATYKGKDYSTKRHQANKFERLYPNVLFKKGDETYFNSIINFINKFKLTKNFNEEGKYEEENAIKLLKHYKALNLDLFVLINEENNKLIGFSLLEKRNDLVFDHVEKCDKEYSGIYPYFVNLLAKHYSNMNITYFSREDDAGDPGLRYSKVEYHPIFLEDKYNFVIKNNLQFLTKLPTINVESSLEIRNIKRKDLKDFYNLANNYDINKYYYLSDEEIPSFNENEWYKYFKESFISRIEFNLGIYLDNKLIGNIVLWNLNNDNSVEIGIRLFTEYQNRGIAYKCLDKTIEYLKKYKISYINFRCYKENKISQNLIIKLNARLINEDDKYYYYQKKIKV